MVLRGRIMVPGHLFDGVSQAFGLLGCLSWTWLVGIYSYE